MKSNLVGELTHRKGTKPSKPLDINPPHYATDPDELPFQEGRPLDSSDEEGGLIKPKAGNFPLEREIFHRSEKYSWFASRKFSPQTKKTRSISNWTTTTSMMATSPIRRGKIWIR
jgi:hypothetical protein